MDDERTVELDCLTAIFPEIIFNPEIPFSISIELPVHPTDQVKAIFPASLIAPDDTLPTPPDSASQHPTIALAHDVESHNLTYLPPLQLRVTLPEGYPEDCPPNFELSTNPAWLSRTVLDELEENGKLMWEEAGRSAVVFGYIDSLQQAAENAFGFAGKGNILQLHQDLRISILDYNIKAIQAAFNVETFDCGVCLDPKKGSTCHRLIDCGHVFCVQCLQDIYNNAISEGDLALVRCPAPGCAKSRAEAQASARKNRKPKTQLSPSELLQIPLDQDMVTRYVRLKHKAELESDKNTIYCPRKWCQGAARSKKHRKPDGLKDVESSDEESDAEDNGTSKKFVAGDDLLAICEDCSFAFCSRCYQSWHGAFLLCAPRPKGELTEEDKASLEYLKTYTTPCPTCATPTQKSHGCNHMICFKCDSHFCYLCSSWLSPMNPYSHFNEDYTRCYQRLWDLEEGDGEPDENWNAGRNVDEDEDVLEVDPDPIAQNPEPVIDPEPEVQIPDIVVEPPPQLQREGPLILRINHLPAPPVPPPAPAARANPGNRRNQRNGQNNAQRNQPPGRRRAVRPRGQQERDERERAIDERNQEAAQQAWVQMFVQMAMNDEEDLLDSDDDGGGAWEIPVR